MTPAAITVILQLVVQYGPGILTGIEGLFNKSNPTVADIQAVFAGLQPYSSFNIPSSPVVLPTAPVIAAAPAGGTPVETTTTTTTTATT